MLMRAAAQPDSEGVTPGGLHGVQGCPWRRAGLGCSVLRCAGPARNVQNKPKGMVHNFYEFNI